MNRNLAIVTWKDVRADVLKVNKELGEIIDDIDPNDNYKLIKPTYLYGDIFVRNGITHLPNNNRLVPVSDCTIDKNIQEELSYSSMPLFLMLEKNNEFFFDTGQRIIPVYLFRKGTLSGVYETMDYMMGRKTEPMWNFASGSRSIFMLPKITDKIGLKKLYQQYNIPTTTQVKQLTDHWKIFKSIAQNDASSPSWQNTILLFGKKWLDKHKSKEWGRFRDYLLKIIWEHAYFPIDKHKFNICWGTFAEIISARRLQPKPYLIDQVKHLLSIAVGNFPGFTVMDNSQDSAPTTCIQKAFVEHYELKQYLPTLMHPGMLQDKITTSPYVYYSLGMPTILEGSPLKKTTSTLINDLREINLLIETMQKNYSKTNLKFKLIDIIRNTAIDCFHYKNDIYSQVRSSPDIAVEDSSFMQDSKMYPGREFCPTSPFFSGCIRLWDKTL